ncbi:energy transducer TonB [Undibacterium fentianense]|uniref:TonB C-terminal domain-containing protein n=1 Tax=Undibacterium fentianense TaxID=2828728 RepID=A0A941IFU3_9BURK|nr:TonB C-terminal domain-containing protein [Undibacterium fentianense]MBR7801091.1 TonB C-terminal domain-containing protein [Undibacterium fentianense]
MNEFIYNSRKFNPHDDAIWKSLALAGLVHGLLLMFLVVGIQWQSSEMVAVEAEVWDLTTREAAPLPVPVEEVKEEPKPVIEAPKEVEKEDPEIAIAQEKKRKELEKKKLEELEKAELKKAELELAKKKEAAEKKRLAQEKAAQDKIFEENMRRLNGQAVKSGAGGLGDALKSTGNNRGDPSYNAKVAAKIRSNTIFVVSDTSSSNPTVEFIINLFPDGSLRGPVKKTKSSGILAFDEAVEKAIDKSQPFPRDKTGSVPASLNIVHRMKD